MAKPKEITIENNNDVYTLFEDGIWLLKGKFTRKNKNKVKSIEFTLKSKGDLYKIKDVYYCKKLNRLEIHLFKGNKVTDTFVVTKHLNKMTLALDEKRDLDFIDYFNDEEPPTLDHCYIPKNDGGLEPDVKKGSIIVGG